MAIAVQNMRAGIVVRQVRLRASAQKKTVEVPKALSRRTRVVLTNDGFAEYQTSIWSVQGYLTNLVLVDNT